MAADNVVDFTGITRLDSDPERILQQSTGKLESVVVIGFDKDGNEYFASSIADGSDVLWLLERAKLRLLHVVDDMDGGPPGRG